MSEILLVGFIYKISKDGNDGIYIGSSKDVNSRRNGHERNCNNAKTKEHDFKLYRHIRQNGGWDTWKFEIVKTVFDISITELGDMECEYQTKLGHNLGTKRRKNVVRVKCICGGEYTKKNKHGHGKSKKHLKYQLQQN